MTHAGDMAPARTLPPGDPGHNGLDGSIFSRRIHRLKDQQDGIAVGCVEKLLQRAQLRNVLSQKFLIVLLRLVHRLHVRPPLPEADLVCFPHTKIL
ncbi:MAG TPA: hypothetical protein VFC29_26035 [Candidatus Limnocylindrales bacterium]|nr:hypothetical protein [Candidatus Limnocylindrales bacterium]